LVYKFGVNMTSTVAQVRLLTGLTTTEISDADVTSIITLADNQIAEEPNTELSTNLDALASAYLTSYMALNNVANTMLADGGDFSLGPLRVSNASGVRLRQTQAQNFLKMYNELIMLGGDGSAITKVETR